MSQDAPEDTPGWTGAAQGGGSGRPGWPQADPHGRPSPSPQPGQPGPSPAGSPQPPQPQYGQPQYGQQQAQHGEPPYGQPQYRQPQYRQPQYGPQQPQNGEAPQYGQQQYGPQPGQYGQPQYGQQQPQYGPPQYGPPQYGNQYAPPPGAAYQQPGYQAVPGVPGPGAAAYYGQPSQSDDRTWAMMGYLLTFVGGAIAPLIVYLVKKDQSPFVRYHGAQALNLSITSAIYSIGLFVLAIIAGAVSHGLGFLLILLYLPLGIGFIVFLIMAAVAANRFEMYRIPSWACLPLVH